MGIFDSISNIAGDISGIADSFTGGAGGLASLGGGLLDIYGTQRNAAMARDFSANQAAIQRGREDTAHQREVTDLKAAGLNPVLSVGGSGLGAGGSPSAPMASGSDPITPAVHSALDARSNRKQMDLINEQIDSTNIDWHNKALMIPGIVADALSKQEDAKMKRNDRIRSDVMTKPFEEVRKRLGIVDQVIKGLPSFSAAASAVSKGSSEWFMPGLFAPTHSAVSADGHTHSRANPGTH